MAANCGTTRKRTSSPHARTNAVIQPAAQPSTPASQTSSFILPAVPIAPSSGIDHSAPSQSAN
jgi:hypothetical protein